MARLTREEFLKVIATAQTKLFVREPYAVVPCSCGDVNCYGWRFVEVRPGVEYYQHQPEEGDVLLALRR